MSRIRSGADVEERIIEAALHCFEKFGYRRTSIAEIARDAGIAVGTIYRYFTNKEELLLKVVKVTNEAWLREVRDLLEQPAPAPERLARLGAASIGHLRQRRILQAVLDRDTDIIPAPVQEELSQRMMQEIVSLMAQVVEQGIAESSFRKVDPEHTAFVLFVAGRALFTQRYYPYEELLPLFMDLVNHGMLAREGSHRR